MARFLTAFCLLCLVAAPATARWKAEYAQLPAATQEWFKKQLVTPETKKALGVTFDSCCDHADVCQDCVVHRYTDLPPWSDGWWYKRGDGEWKMLPPHIVEYMQWTPTGKPVLFLYPYDGGTIPKGTPVCLKVPGGAT